MMKRLLYVPMAGLAALALSLTGCSTNGDDIGDLYGTWKVEQLLTSGSTVKFDTIFIGFQGEAYSYRANWKPFDWGIYEQKDGKLTFGLMENGADMSAMQVYEKKPTFTIDHLDGDNMRLSRNDTVWTLKKLF